jgi:hypothetical protein
LYKNNQENRSRLFTSTLRTKQPEKGIPSHVELITSSDAMWPRERGFPDMDKDRVGWNSAWEYEIKRLSTFVYSVDAAQLLDSYPHEDHDIANHRSTIRSLCSLQRQLTVVAYQRFTVDDLEQKWLGLDMVARQNHLLEGIVRACRRPNDNERLHCDEITLPYLQNGDGRGFLDLLRSFMIPDTTTIPAEPRFLPNARFDGMLPPGSNGLSERQIFFRADMTLLRNAFICESSYMSALSPSDENIGGGFLWATLASLYGQPDKPVLFMKGPGPKMTRAERKNLSETAKVDRATVKNNTVTHCENLSCGKVDNQTWGNERFMMCSNCSSKMQRRIFYCSKSAVVFYFIL